MVHQQVFVYAHKLTVSRSYVEEVHGFYVNTCIMNSLMSYLLHRVMLQGAVTQLTLQAVHQKQLMVCEKLVPNKICL